MKTNTEKLMAWADRMYKTYGSPATGIDWCRKIAYYMNEEGNDNPSDECIFVAEDWEAHPYKIPGHEITGEDFKQLKDDLRKAKQKYNQLNSIYRQLTGKNWIL